MRLLYSSDTDELDPAPPPGWRRASMVASLDGVAAVEGDSAALSGPADRAVYRILRQQSDVILVGATTADHPGYAKLKRPLVVISNSGNVRSPAPELRIITTSIGLASARRTSPHAELLVAGDHQVDLAQAMAILGAETRVLIEGGPTLLTALLSSQSVDELCLTVAPMLLGAGPRLVPEALGLGLTLRAVGESDGTLFLRYLVRGPRNNVEES